MSFDYLRSTLDNQDSLQIQVSNDGTHFTTIGQILGPANDSTFQHFSVDVSSYISANTTVRLAETHLSASASEPEFVYIDNVNIAYALPSTNNSVTFTENGAPVPISLFSQITDPDNTNMHSATVTLTDEMVGDRFFVGGTLVSNGSTGTIDGINYSVVDSGSSIEIDLTGQAANAAYQAALEAITFSNSSDNPNTTARVINVVVNDGTANSNTATSTIHVVSVNDPPTATDDNVITNVGTGTAFQIPDWVLLANDIDPDSQVSITGVSNQSGGTASHSSGAVTFTDTGSSGGSFDYTVSDGSLTDTGHVTVSEDTSGNLDGTNGADILIGKSSGGSTINGNGGNDILFGGTGADTLTGGAGSDTFVYNFTSDLQPGAGHFDTINDFTHNSDHLDFAAIGGLNSNVQAVTVTSLVSTPANIAAHTIDIVTTGGNTFIYANSTGAPEAIASASMEIHLPSVTGVTSADFILHH